MRRGGVIRLRPLDPSGPVIEWGDLTIASASTRYIHDPNTETIYGPFAGGVAAVATISGTRYLQLEGERTNKCLDYPSWTASGGAALAGSIADPLGGTAAFRASGLNGTGTHVYSNAITGFPGSTSLAHSAFVKPVSGTGVISLEVPGTSVPWDIDASLLPAGWSRLTEDHPAVTVLVADPVSGGAGQGGFRFRGKSGGAVSLDVYWPGCEQGAKYPTSPIPPSTVDVTRTAEEAYRTAPRSQFYSSGFVVKVRPYVSSAEGGTSQRHNVFWLGASNALYLVENGGVYDLHLDSTGENLSVPGLTFSRNQELTITVDWSAGTLTVAGAATGNGSDSGTPGGWSGTVYVGCNDTPADHFDGLISEPEAT